MAEQQKDNSTLLQKVTLRRHLLAELAEPPVILETHGGAGKLFERCYADVRRGVVFEKDADKAAILARQRPTWAVYECDCEMALRAGVGGHLPVNLVDVDPYGNPWEVLGALFASERPWPARLGIVVQDGLRQKIRMGGGWAVGSLQAKIEQVGNSEAFRSYLTICQELLGELAATRGYRMARWAGYYCGAGKQNTHYGAVLVRGNDGRAQAEADG